MKRWTWVVLVAAAAGIVLAIFTAPYLKSPDKHLTGAANDPRKSFVTELQRDFDLDKAKQPPPETLKTMQDLAAITPGGKEAVLPFYDLWLRRMYDNKLGDSPEFRELSLAMLALEPAESTCAVGAVRQAKNQAEKNYQVHLVHTFGKAALTPLFAALVEDANNAGDNYLEAAKSPYPQLLADLGGDALSTTEKGLKSFDVPVRRQALRTLALMVPEQAAEELDTVVAALSDKEPSVRAFAALVLGGELVRKDKQPAPALLRLLADTDPLVRLAAARTLSRHDTVDKSRVESVLTALLKENPFASPIEITPTPTFRMWWDVAGMGEFAIWKGGGGLTAYNSLFWEETVAHVLLGLGPNRLKPEAIVELLRSCPHDGRHLATLLAAQGERAKAVVPELAKMVKDPNSLQRRKALVTLGRLGDPIAAEAVPAIVAALDHEDARTRWQAFLALMRIDTAAARKKLPETLQGAVNAASGTLKRTDLTRVSVWTRFLWRDSAAVLVPVTDENMSVDALGLFRTPTDWDVMAENDRIDNMLNTLAAMESPSKDVGPLGKEAVPFLLAAWEGAARNPVTRARHGNKALALLAREGAAAEMAVPHLILALNYYDEAGKAELSKALVKIGPAALPYLIAVLDDPKKSVFHLKVLETLQHFGDKAQPAVPAVVRALCGQDDEVSDKAVETFRFLRGASKDAVPDLCTLVRSTDSKAALSLLGARTVGLVGSPPPVAPLVAASVLMPGPTSKLRRHAADALGNLGPAATAALPDLLDLFHGDNLELRVVAVRAISAIGKDAVEPLAKALNDPREMVRYSAVQALTRMPPEVARPALPAVQKLVAAEKADDVKKAAEVLVKNLEIQ